jgi:UDP-GlcNAc:undecaprenyl-phosphate GlcNAc-1-phosphate transferase
MMMLTLAILPFSLGLAACFLLTPVVRRAALRVGLIDHPDRHRKLHARPVPLAGGIAILLAVACAVPLAGLAGGLGGPGRDLAGVFLGGAVIAVVGVIDDQWALSGKVKLVGQAAAVAVVLASGVVIRHVRLFNLDVELGLLAVPCTALWLLAAINSLNLLDGMDGLLTTVGLVASLTIAGMALVTGHGPQAVTAAALCGALLAFLRYNFPPASIFLGDCGSMLLGLLLGTLAIQTSLKGSLTVALFLPDFSVLALPFFDTLMAIVRRKLTGRSIYATDRGHLHHCLMRRGFSTRGILGIVVGCSALTGAAALLSLTYNNDLLALVTVLAVITTLVAARLFGHAELALLREHLLSPFWQRDGRSGRQIQVRLQGSRDWGQLWDRIKTYADDLDLQSVQLDINAPSLHEGFFARWERPKRPAAALPAWRMEVPLLADNGLLLGRVLLAGGEAGQEVPVKLLEMTGFLRRLSVAAAAPLAGGAAAAPTKPLGKPHLAWQTAAAGERTPRETVAD